MVLQPRISIQFFEYRFQMRPTGLQQGWQYQRACGRALLVGIVAQGQLNLIVQERRKYRIIMVPRSRRSFRRILQLADQGRDRRENALCQQLP